MNYRPSPMAIMPRLLRTDSGQKCWQQVNFSSSMVKIQIRSSTKRACVEKLASFHCPEKTQAHHQATTLKAESFSTCHHGSTVSQKREADFVLPLLKGIRVRLTLLLPQQHDSSSSSTKAKRSTTMLPSPTPGARLCEIWMSAIAAQSPYETHHTKSPLLRGRTTEPGCRCTSRWQRWILARW
jgi:hypothetical protein